MSSAVTLERNGEARPADPAPAPDPKPDLAASAIRLVEADPRTALTLAKVALAAAGRAGDSAGASVALRAKALATWELGDVVAAAALLRKAVEAGERDGPEGAQRAAEARRTLCWVLSDLGDIAGALHEAELAAPHLHGVEFAILLIQRAWVLQRAGRLEEALADYRGARVLLRREPSPLHEARLFSNRSLLYLQQGRLAAAEADLRRAESLFESLGQAAAVAKTVHNRGCVAARHGDVPRALSLYDHAEERYEALAMPRALGMLDSHRAELLLSVRLVPEARRVAARAVRRLAAAGAAAECAEALLLFTKAALLSDDWTAARAAAEEAERAFARQGRAVWRAGARLAGARADWAAGDRSEATLRQAREAAADLRAAGFRPLALEAALIAGHSALAIGRREVAAQELGWASRARRSGPAELRGRAWHAEALLRLMRDDRIGARSAIGAGLRALERARLMLGATELRAHAAAEGEPLFRLGLRLAVEGGRPGTVLAWTERWRAASAWFRPVRPADDAALAADLDELRTIVGAVAAAAVQKQNTAGLLRRQAELEETILTRKRRAPGRLDETRVGPALSLAELRAGLDRRALLELVDVDGILWGLMVAPKGVRLRALGPAAGAISELHALRFALRRLTLGRADVASLGAAASSAQHAAGCLDNHLIAPFREELGDRPLVVVPTGPLHALPWAALPGCRGRAVTVAPSAALWLRARATPPPPDGRVLLVAGPGLEGGADEVGCLARRYPDAQLLCGPDATARRVLKAMDGARLVHIAAHGSFRTDNPLFSSLSLADGPLTVHELERLGTAPRLLVLSACEAGLSDVRSGDELMGFATAMLALGTQTLVAGAGLLPDSGARDTMLAFHERLAEGASPAAALAAAQTQGEVGPDRLAAEAGFLCLGAGC
jgi:CHAT domain/Tetratricopeptide repeat